MKTTFKVLVGYPSAACEDQFTEVVYLTDANGHFGSAVDVLWGLVRAGRVPPALLVGIGYPVDRLRAEPAVRTRDQAPPDPAADEGSFMSFLSTEVRPRVAARFRVASARTTYFGHSLGGLLGAHTLLTRPTTFDRYLLSSPSLWWDRPRLLTQEQTWADAHDDLPARVFAGVGGAETGAAVQGRRRDVVGDLVNRRSHASPADAAVPEPADVVHGLPRRDS